MNIRFKVITNVKKFNKETLFAFLKPCNGKHTQVLKYDYKEPCKKIFDAQALDEVLTLYKDYSGVLLKGKNGFWINVFPKYFEGLMYWSGGIKIKNVKKTDEIIAELLELFRSISFNGQLLFGSIATDDEYDMKHKVTDEYSYGWEGSSMYDFKEYFPGVYWCTLFGKEMTDIIGKERFLNIPDVEYLNFPDETVAFHLNIPLADEHNDTKLKAQTEIAKYIGKDLFFDLKDKKHKPSYPLLLKKRIKDFEIEMDSEDLKEYFAKFE